jgi:phosphohistidine swiveling domain-containing protein
MTLGGGNLFELAGSIAELLGAPVTIEDTDTVVLAYSAGAQSVDEVRVGTILGRRVPDHYRRLLREAGVFERLRSEPGVIYIDLGDATLTPRAAIAVRDGQEMIGAIWAAVTDAPTAAQDTVLRTVAPVVAGQMVRERARTTTAHAAGAARVGELLAGGPHAGRAAGALRMPGPVTVAAVGAVDAEGPLSGRVLGSLGLHLDALVPNAVVAQLEDVAYAVVSAPERYTRTILADYTSRTQVPVVVGVGRAVDQVADAHRSRLDADRVLAALRHQGRAGVVAGLAETLAVVLALEVADTLADLRELSPLAILAEHDRRHGSELVTSAQSYLDHAADITVAAGVLHVHPNTLRNRLRRAAECGVHLDDPDTRLVLSLHLKLGS